MTPTSDERREVARKLREYIVYAKEHDLCDDYDMGSGKVTETRCTLYNDIASCIEECGNFNLSAEEVFTRLADLIDPTCVPEAHNYGSIVGNACPRCGWSVAGYMRYCPGCGARVVEG